MWLLRPLDWRLAVKNLQTLQKRDYMVFHVFVGVCLSLFHRHVKTKHDSFSRLKLQWLLRKVVARITGPRPVGNIARALGVKEA